MPLQSKADIFVHMQSLTPSDINGFYRSFTVVCKARTVSKFHARMVTGREVAGCKKRLVPQFASAIMARV